MLSGKVSKGNLLKGYLAAIVAAATYGTNPLFAINLYDAGMNPNSVLLWRYALGMPFVAIMLLFRGRSLAISRSELAPALVLGILMATSSLTLFASYKYMNAGIASTLLFIYPIMVTLLMIFFFHEKFKLSIVLCLVVMIIGLYMLMMPSNGVTVSSMGLMLVVLSSLTYAIYLVMVNVSERVKRIPTLKLLFYVLLSGCAMFLLLIPAGNPLVVPHSSAEWFYVLALALIPTVLSLICTTVAIQNIGATPTAILGALEPVTAVMISVFILGQPMTVREIAGAVLILAAATIVVISGSVDKWILKARKMFPSVRKRG